MSNEKNILHNNIWKISEQMRGSVDSWDFKQYVFAFLFYRYLSENLVEYLKKVKGVEFDYSKLNDTDITEDMKNEIIKEKGFFIYPSELFENVVVNIDNIENITDKVKDIFNNIEKSACGTEAEENIKNLFSNVNLESSQLGYNSKNHKENVIKLLKGINSMELKSNNETTIDIFGDAYEFLMNMYATNAGKSGGEFYTPQEVSKLLAKITIENKNKIRSVYDPTCGSGSLLLQVVKLLGNKNIKKGIYGQENNATTYNLCRMNMFLHDIHYSKFNIKCGDTLKEPKHLGEKFDAIVSNPPYSIKWEGKDNPELAKDERFSPAGALAPKSKADLAFIMHVLSMLSDDGIASIVCFPGVLYRNGAEQKIREYLVKNNFVDSIIQLPENLFFGTSISTCIMILKKSKTTKDILFVDASKQFEKNGNKNKLTDENIDYIFNLIMNRKEIEGETKLSTIDEVAKQKYNLSTSTYVEFIEEKEEIDIKELNKKIKEMEKERRKTMDKYFKFIDELEKMFEEI